MLHHLKTSALTQQYTATHQFPSDLKGYYLMPILKKTGYMVIISSIFWGSGCQANSCIPPERPFVPAETDAAREFRDLIYDDYQVYFEDFSRYLQCLDQERARAFQEGQEVSEEYRQFFDQVVTGDR